MRRLIVLLVFLVALAGVAFIVVIGLKRYLRPAPTTFGWDAHITTFAGDGAPAYRDSAKPETAAFADPFGVAVALDGTVYVSDAADNNRIRKISPDGSVSTFAGGTEGFADGTGSSAAFNTPSGLVIDSSSNLYVADTSNNRIRKVTREGAVSTIAGDGNAGYLDGPAAQAQFNGPIGVAVDARGNVFIADTYNDRIRKLDANGQVSTVAGGNHPGFVDGPSSQALFDTPSGLVSTDDGLLIVADTGNDRLRKITPDGQVTTLQLRVPDQAEPLDLDGPLGLTITRDRFLYVTELSRSRVLQVTLEGNAAVVWDANDGANNLRFSQAAGIAVDSKGDLFVADSGNYLIRKLSSKPSDTPGTQPDPSQQPPRLTNETLQLQSLLWPLDPQQSPHEVAATMGEVRGSFDTTDSRHHLHSGLDVFGAYGDVVRAVRSDKINSPSPNWAFGDLGEGIRVGVVSYIHIHVARDKDAKLFSDPRFIPVKGDDGKVGRIRVRRGTRFKTGDALGTVNRMYHVHMNVGPPGKETNPLSLLPVGFSDRIQPTIEREGIQLLNESGEPLTEKQDGELVVRGRVRIVVDAFDRADMNPERRRLGLYKLGYQVMKRDGSPAQGFETARVTMIFNRLPPDRKATKLAYAAESGITVYGSKTTRFLYEITNEVRDGRATPGVWDTSSLSPGPYILRIIAADFSGNEAQERRDVPIVVK
jgi:sugar lactone lactonase YvrE